MEKPSSTSDCGGTTLYNTVFIDTSLDTHLAMIVSDFDTVSDLKKKILYEHPLCFPNIGGISIHALKVKRKGYFYHLSDSMFVKSAFDGVSKSWFLSVDASTLEDQSENQHCRKPNLGDLVASLGITGNPSADRVGLRLDAPARRLSNNDDSLLPYVQRDQLAEQKPSAENNADNNYNILSLDTNNRSGTELQEKDYNNDAATRTACGEENSRTGIKDVQFNASLEGAPDTRSVMKRKRQTNKREDEVHNEVLKEKNASADLSYENASEQGMVPDNSLVTEGRGTVVTHDIEMVSKDNADEPCRISSSNINQRSGNEVLPINVLCEGTAVSGKHVECESYNSKNAVVNKKCKTSLEEVSLGPATNKKQKTVRKDDNENSSKENRFLACDSTRETLGPDITVSQFSFGDKQKGTNATFDHLSTDMSIDEKLLTTSLSGGKRNRKKKSSKFRNEVVAVVPSPAEDETRENPENAAGVHQKNLEREPNAGVVRGHFVQDATIFEPCTISVKKKLCVPLHVVEENNRVPCSLEVNIRANDSGNVVSKNDSPEGFPPLAVQEANTLDKDSWVTKHDNVMVHDGRKFGNDQTGRVAEGKESSQLKDSEAMPLVKCTSSGRDEIDLNSEVVVTSNLSEANGNVELEKSSKRRRKSKKSRDSVTSGIANETASAIGISSTEPHETMQNDHSSDKSKKEQSLLSLVDEKKVPKETTVNTSVLANDRETDNVIRNVLASLKDVNKNPMNAENKEEKSRKKTKRKRSSAGKTLPEMPKEDENVICKSVTPSIDGIREVEVDASSKLTKKAHLVKTSSKNELNGSNLKPENNTGVGTHLIQDLNGNFPKSGRTDDANKNMEVSCESDRTIVNDNFVPSKDRVTKTKGADNKGKASKDKKKLDVHSNGPSPDLQNRPKLYENQSNGGKAQLNSSSVEPHRTLLKGEGGSLKLQPKTKLARVAGIGEKAPASKKSDKLSKNEEATRPNAINCSATHTHSDKTKQTIAATSSSLESSKNILPQSKRGNRRQAQLDSGRVFCNNFNGEIENSLEHKKSLLATSGTIFKEYSNESSDDEDGVDNSDGSTRTPSDNSLSSDYSDGDSSAQQNGSYGSKRKESGRRNITKSYSSVTLEKILRSSSRYKAAKLTASQSQGDDPEGQPLEFVPDSQADQ